MRNSRFGSVMILFLFCSLVFPAMAFASIMPPPVLAQAAIVMDADSHEVLYEKESTLRMYPASTTKIMTFIVAQKKGAMDSVVTVSPQAAACEGSSLETSKGDRIRLGDLLYGLMLVSGNDAAEAIAEHVGGSIPAFVRLMNDEARNIGALNTHFTNPHGLPDNDHFTTAYDLALITADALTHPEFTKVVGTKETTLTFLNGQKHKLKNTNKLLGVYPGLTGAKTGYTSAAGDCLVATAKRGNIQLIAVILNSDERWDDAANLLDFGFAFKAVK